MKRIVISGSVAYDYLMHFPGMFRDYLPDHHSEEPFNLSFGVEQLVRRFGGVAPNIAYTLALLRERPIILAAVGEDFGPYRTWLERHGVDTTWIKVVPGEFTASFFGMTDQEQSQLGMFYVGALRHAREIRLKDLPFRPTLVMISPDDVSTMEARIAECRALGLRYAFDPGQQILRLSPETLRAGIEAAYMLFANEYEAELLARKTGWDLEDWLRRVPVIVITHGPEGSVVYAEGQKHLIPAVPPREVVDPTGAGDAYRGGFLKGFLAGLDWETCGKIGALAATYCVEHEGPQEHTFTWADFRARYRRAFGEDLPLEIAQAPAETPTI